MSLGSESSFFYGSSGAGGSSYEIERSLRFNSADSPFLNRVFGTATSTTTFSISMWVKRVEFSQATYLFVAGTGTQGYFVFDADIIRFYGVTGDLKTNAKYRDPSAWYHIVGVADTSNATADDRMRLYVNGVQLTNANGDFSTHTQPSQGASLGDWNSAATHYVNRLSTGNYQNFYLADFQFIDGQALAASDFGKYDTNNVWQPIEYAGTYGNNGFKLDFSDISSNAALGTDSSSNSNTFTVNSLIAATTVSPTIPSSYVDYTMGFYLNGQPPLFLTKQPDGTSVADNISHGAGSGTDWVVDDVVQWAIDKDNSKLWLGLNNTWYTGNPSTATDPGMANLGTSALFLGLAYNSPNLQLEVATTSAYTPPTGYTYWSAAETGSWVGSGTNTSNVGNDIFNTAIPTSGKIYIEAKIKGGVSTFASVGLMNLGLTRVQGDALRDSPVNGDSANDTGAGGELTGSYCTFNPLQSKAGGYTNTYAEGNLQFSGGGDGTGTVTFGSGKKYFELTCTSAGGFSQGYYGIVQTAHGAPRTWATSEVAAFRDAGVFYGDSSTGSAPAAITVAGGVYGFAIDVDNQKMYISVDGSWLNSGDPASGTGASFTGRDFSDYVPLVSLGAADTQVWTLNTGQSLFTHSAPSGFKPLCTATITESTVPNGVKEFESKLYTGNGSTQDITDLNFSPSLAWLKTRNTPGNHHLFDVIRGVNKSLKSDSSAATETTTAGLTAFNSDGYSLGDSNNDINGSGNSFVSWNFNAGSSTTTIAVGGLNSSLYDQSQTWSSSTFFNDNGNAFYNSGGSAAQLFDNVESGSGSSGDYPLPVDGGTFTLTFTQFSSASTVTVKLAGTGNALKINGSFVTIDSASDSTQTFNVSGLTSIEWLYNGGSNYCYLGSIAVDGIKLIDSGVSVPNVPSIASTVRANPSAGFSIVKWNNGTISSTASVAHGLNAAPDFYTIKDIDSADSWYTYHNSMGNTKYLTLDTGTAATTSSTMWGDTSPDSNTFPVGTTFNGTGDYIGYCFTSVNGFSKQGKYVGNGESTDGPFIYTGFRVEFLLLKGIDGAHYWAMHDSARNPYNTNDFEYLWANDAGGTGTGYDLDFLSNGFKIRNSNGNWNNSSQEYVYIAFASNPFRTTRAR